MTHQDPATRTTHVAEIEDPISGEVTRLEAPTTAELDDLIEAHTAEPNTSSPD